MYLENIPELVDLCRGPDGCHGHRSRVTVLVVVVSQVNGAEGLSRKERFSFASDSSNYYEIIFVISLIWLGAGRYLDSCCQHLPNVQCPDF